MQSPLRHLADLTPERKQLVGNQSGDISGDVTSLPHPEQAKIMSYFRGM